MLAALSRFRFCAAPVANADATAFNLGLMRNSVHLQMINLSLDRYVRKHSAHLYAYCAF